MTAAVSDSTELCFGPFRLSGRHGPLLRGSTEVRLQPKAIALLWALLRQNGGVLSRAALLDAVWPGSAVGDEALTFQIQALRRALEDDPKLPRYVLTVHRVGFRFGAPVQAGSASPAAVTPVLFVGRERELERLQALYARAAAGERQLVLLTGEAGIGKSGLIERFLAGLAALPRPPRSSRGHCIDRQQSGEPYLPVLEALGRLLREAPDDSAIELLRRSAPNWLLHLPALLTPIEYQALRQQTAGSSPERMLREMADALDLLAEREPLVLVIEDLHWSDPSTLQLLRLLAGRRHPARLLILCTARPPEGEDEVPPPQQLQRELVARGQAEEVALGTLGLAEVRDYLAARAAALPADAGRALRLYERSGGHPLFLAQLTDYLLQTGSESADDRGTALPPRLRDLLELQLAQLPLADQLLLEVASVCDTGFTAAGIAACVALPLPTVEEQLERLVRQRRFVEDQGLSVWPDGTVGGRYGFRHVLYRAALRRRLGAAREARLHQQLGERLESAYGARTAEVAAELAGHFEAAGRPDRALAYAILTTRRALERLAAPEVRQQFARGMRLVTALPADPARDRAEFALRVIAIHGLHIEQGYSAPEAAPHLLRMQALVPGIQDPALLEPGLAALWLFNHFRCQLDEALNYAREIRELGQRLGKPVLECCGVAWASNSLHLLGRHREAAAEAAAAIHIARAHATDDSPGWQAGCAAIAGSAIVSWFLGSPERALRQAQEARSCVRRINNASALCTIYSMLTSILLFRRDWRGLVTACDEAVALCEQHSHQDGLEWAQMHRLVGLCHLEDDPAPVLEALHTLTARRHRAGAYIGLPSIYVSEAEVQIRLGRLGAAVAALDKARELVTQRQMRAWEPELLRVEAELLLARGGEPAAALPPLQQALALATERGAQSLALRIAISLARLTGDAGSSGLRAISAGFAEGQDTPDQREARALLDAIAQSP